MKGEAEIRSLNQTDLIKITGPRQKSLVPVCRPQERELTHLEKRIPPRPPAGAAAVCVGTVTASSSWR
ncbi:hypothetical protein GWI33_008959, partial [Rhynchophorus ferrugineus]